MRRVRLSWIDFLVVAATSFTFAAALLTQHHRRPDPPTPEAIQEIAQELGVTADDLRRAAAEVPPPPRGTRPTDEQRAAHRRALAAALALPASRVDAVMERHRPPGGRD